MNSFSYGDEMGHKRDSDLSTKKTNGVEKSGKRKCCLRLRKPTREHRLKNDVRDQANKPERLSYPHQQFRTVEVRGGPRTGVFRVQDGSQSHAPESEPHKQTRVQTLRKKQGSDDREYQ